MEEKQQSVILKIGSDYYSLTPAEKRLADFILANQEKVVQLSISELARASAVAEATVSRFSRHMGYKSFPLLKLAVANATAQARLGDTPLSGQVEPQDDLPTMAQKLYRANTEAMLQTMEVLDLNVVARWQPCFSRPSRFCAWARGAPCSLPGRRPTCFPPSATSSGRWRTPICRPWRPPLWMPGK